MKLSFIFYEPIPELAELDRRMGRLAELGYQGVELCASHPFPYSAEQVLALSQKHRLPVVSFLSGWSYFNEKLCLASPQEDLRQRAVTRLIEYSQLAGRLRAVLVVGQMQGFRSDELNEALAQERIADCLRTVAETAARQNATLVLEPVNHLQVGFNHTAAEAAALVARVGSPALSYMLDTIHLNIEERSLLDAIRIHGPRIRHFHLCETNGGPFGTGHLGFSYVLGALACTGYAHFVSVKVYRHVAWEEAAAGAIAHVRETCPSLV